MPETLQAAILDLKQGLGLDFSLFDGLTAFEPNSIAFNAILSVDYQIPFSIIRPVEKGYGTQKKVEGVLGKNMLFVSDLSASFSDFKLVYEEIRAGLGQCVLFASGQDETPFCSFLDQEQVTYTLT